MKLNGWQIHGTLTRPMTGRSAEQYIEETYRENRSNAGMLVRAAWDYGISARAAEAGYFAIHVKSRNPVRFVIEEGSLGDIIGGHGPVKAESNRPERPVSVAPRTRIRYAKPIAPRRFKDAETIRENLMATTRTATRKPKAAPVEEPEEVEEELLDDEELEDEEDEDLEDEEDEEEDEDEEDEEDEDEDEEDEEDESVDDESDESDDDAPDYTPYASKLITPVMQDFADWMDFAIFKPVGESIAKIGKTDPVRLVAIAGTARMEFQRSEFNKSRRAERQAEAAAAKAAKAKAPKATKPAAVKPTAKPTAKASVTAKPVAKAKAAPAKAPAKAAAKAPATRAAGRKKGPAPY